MKRVALIAVAVFALFALLLAAPPAEAGSRGMGGGFYVSTPGLAINAGWPGGVSVFVGGGSGYYYGGGYGPRFGYPGYRRHRGGYGPRIGYRRHRGGYGNHRNYFAPHYLYDSRWENRYFDRHRDAPPVRKWTSRTWIPGRMTSQGFTPGYWQERRLGP
jgi:hypothetical protein